jgi:hypothetical protein
VRRSEPGEEHGDAVQEPHYRVNLEDGELRGS